MDRDEMRKTVAALLRARISGDAVLEQAICAALAAQTQAAVNALEAAVRSAACNDNA